MNEEEKNEDESTSKDSDKGIQSKTISDLDRAIENNERYARESDRREEILKREEALEVSRRVGGTTEAGKESKIKKEETPKEYRVRVEKEMAEGKTQFGD